MLQRLAAIFPGRLYVELQRHGLPVEAAIEPGLLALAYAHDLPLVATNEAFFPTADDFEAHDALLCIAEGTYISQAERRRLTPQHAFVILDIGAEGGRITAGKQGENRVQRHEPGRAVDRKSTRLNSSH